MKTKFKVLRVIVISLLMIYFINGMIGCASYTSCPAYGNNYQQANYAKNTPL